MPTTRRSRLIAATPEQVWRVVGSPEHLPRWWPRVSRVEDVRDDGWTSLLPAKSGRLVRADYRVEERDASRLLRWSQELEGSPFQRILREHTTSIELAPGDDGATTTVTIATRQRLRGFSRFGGVFFRGAARRQLDEALDGLERTCG